MTNKHEIIGEVRRIHPQQIDGLRGQIMLIKDPQTQQEMLYQGNPSAKPGITTTNDHWYINALRPMGHAGKWKQNQFLDDLLIPYQNQQVKITVIIEELD